MKEWNTYSDKGIAKFLRLYMSMNEKWQEDHKQDMIDACQHLERAYKPTYDFNKPKYIHLSTVYETLPDVDMFGTAACVSCMISDEMLDGSGGGGDFISLEVYRLLKDQKTKELLQTILEAHRNNKTIDIEVKEVD